MGARPQLESREMPREPFDYLVDIKLGIENSSRPGYMDIFGEQMLLPPGFKISEVVEGVDYSASTTLSYQVETPFRQLKTAKITMKPDGAVVLNIDDRNSILVNQFDTPDGNLMRAIIKFIEYYEVFHR